MSDESPFGPLVHFDTRGLEAAYTIEILDDGTRRFTMEFGEEESLTLEFPREQAIGLGGALLGSDWGPSPAGPGQAGVDGFDHLGPHGRSELAITIPPPLRGGSGESPASS